MICKLITLILIFLLSLSANAQDPPSLGGFALNLNNLNGPLSKLIGLFFTSAVNPATCDVTAITLHSSADGTGSTYTPTSGNCSYADPEFDSRIAVQLSNNDWQAIINDPVLATSADTTYITMTGSFITNNEGVANTAIEEPLPADEYVPPPSMDSFSINRVSLDLNVGTLEIEFTEPAIITEPTFITLTSGNFSYTLTGGIGSISPSEVNILSLESQDFNALKMEFGSSVNSSLWNVTILANAAVSGEIGNSFTELGLSNIIPDTTLPEVNSLSLDMDNGNMTITFSELIEPNTQSISSIYIVNSTRLPFMTNYSLTGSTIMNSVDFLSVTINISSNTLLLLKSDEGIATSIANTFIYFEPESFSDFGSNTLDSSFTALGIGTFTPDTISPILHSFEISLQLYTITLTFSEPIRQETFNSSTIILFDGTPTNSYTLSSQINVSFTEHQTVLILSLDSQQVNDLQLLIFNSQAHNVYLNSSSTTCSDTSNNPVIPSFFLQVAMIHNDSHYPYLISYEPVQRPPQNYSMKFTFSEYVNPNSFDIGSLTLTLINPITGINVYNSLSGGSITLDSYYNVTYHFSNDDLSGLFPILYQIAYYTGNMTISFTPDFVTDLAGNIMITLIDPFLFISMENDVTMRPSLISFSLDLNQGVIQLEFSEPVLILAPLNSLIITSSVSNDNPHPLSNIYEDLYLNFGNSLQIQLDPNDVNVLLSNSDIATGIDNTFLNILSQFAIDYSGNYLSNLVPIQASNVIVISTSQVQPTSTLSITSTSSTTITRVSSSTLLTMSSDESSTSFSDTTTIPTMTSVSTSIPMTTTSESTSVPMTTTSESTSVPMTTTSESTSVPMTTTSESTSVPMTTTSESTSVPMTTTGVSTSVPMTTTSVSTTLPTTTLLLVTTTETIVIVSPSSTIVSSTTMSSTTVSSTTTTITSTTSVIPSPTSSVLPTPLNVTSAGLDMNIGLLNISFSNPFQFGGIQVSGISFNNGTQVYTLTGNNEIITDSDVTIKIGIFLLQTDIDFLKIFQVSDSWSLSILPNTVYDTSGNSNSLQNLSFNFVPDITPPFLSSSALDMNQGQISLTFNEPVRQDSINLSSIFITNSSLSPQYSIQSSVVISGGPNTIICTINNIDLNNIKSDVNVATDFGNSYILLSTGFIQDYSSNSIQSTNTPALEYLQDFTSPTLTSYTIDLNSGVITMMFDETIAVNTLNANGAIITGIAPPNLISTPPNLMVSIIGFDLNTISLTSDDTLNDIKLALYGSSDAYLTIPSTFIQDTAGNPILPISNSFQLQAHEVIPDTTSPTVTQVVVQATAPNDADVTFQFDEYVILSSLNETAITITLNNTLINGTFASFSNGMWSATTNDSLTYHFSQSDLNFGIAYFISSNAGQISVSFNSNLVTDLNGNSVVASPSPFQQTFLRQDFISPSLQEFNVDLDAGNLILTFSEDVIVLAIPGGIQFQNSVVSPSETYSLHSNAYNNQTGTFGSIITIRLETQDTEMLLNNTDLAVNMSNTFILLSGPFATDYSGNVINVTGPVQASNVITTSSIDNAPILLDVMVNLNESLLMLTFNITVNPSLTVPASISLTDGTTSYSISSDATISQGNSDGTAIQVSYTSSDAASIKYNILTSNSTWNISLSANTVISTEGDGNLPQSLPINTIIADTSSPNLIEYTFDMDSGVILMTFDEPMSTDTYNSSMIWLSGYASTEPTGISLANSQIIASISFNTIITLQIQTPTLNVIKANNSMATGIDNTNLYFILDSFQDLSSNSLQSSLQSIQPTSFTSDATAPSLMSYSIDLNEGIISLTFDEPVKTPSFDISSLTVYTLDLTNSLAITNSTIQTSEGYADIINSLVQYQSLDQLKSLIVLQSGGALQARLSMTSNTVTDANGNDVANILSSNALISSAVISDTTSPMIISLIAGDETQRTLQMTFNEYVQPSSWNGNALSLYLNTSTGIYTFTNFIDGFVTSGVSTILTYVISTSRFQEDLLSIRYQQAYYSGSIGVSLLSTALTDISNNPVMQPSEPVYYFSSAVDPTPPELLSFEINLDTAQLTMSFSELIIINQIPGNIIIQNTATSPTQSYTLTSSSYASQEGMVGTNVNITLLQHDIISIAGSSLLGNAISNTYLRVNPNLAVDYSGNFILESSQGIQASFVTDYSGPLNPQVTSFDLDLDADQLTLHFTSEVNVSTLLPSRITLINTSSVMISSQTVTLTNATVIAQGIQTDFRILLSTSDVINIKRHPLCYTVDNCYGTFDQGLALNSLNVQSDPTPLIRVTNLIIDVTPPRFLSFPVFDLNSGLFTIIFSEPINGSSADFTQVTFSNAKSNPTESITLTEGFTSPDHIEIDFFLDHRDLNALKYHLNLCTERDNCWIKLPSFFITDIGSNPYLHSNYQVGATGSYHQPTVFIPDTTPPVLESFTIDMNEGQIILSFDEVINETLFNPSDVTLLNAQSGSSLSLTLDDDTASNLIATGTAIQLTLTVDDLNWIKARELFKSYADSYLSLATVMTDISGNAYSDVSGALVLQVSNYITDTTQVQLTSFDAFNIDNGSFYITFDEPVNAHTINVSGIVISSDNSNNSINYRLTGGTISYITEAKLRLMIQLTGTDRIAIKLLNLATSQTDTYISLDYSTINDTSGNPNVPASPLRLATGGYTPDTSLAKISYVELDMNVGLLKLTFNDVIDASTFTSSLLLIQNKSSIIGSSSHIIATSVSSIKSSDEILVYFSNSDFNAVKANLYLATQINNTYISFPPTLAQDIEGRNVIGVSDTSAQRASSYIRDVTPPQLESYDIDMDSGTMTMTFTESVLLASFRPNQLSLQDNPTTPSATYHLTSGLVSTSNPNTPNVVADPIIKLTFDYNDLNEIKSRRLLATTSSNTYLNGGAGLFSDTSGNDAVSVQAVNVTTYTGDTTLPELATFALDLRSTGKVILKFSEAVYYTSNIQNTVMLQNAMTNPTVVIPLASNEPVTQTGLDEITITLSNAHSNQLLTDNDIAGSSDALFISMSPGGVYDYSAGQGQGQSIATLTHKVTYLYRTCFDSNTYNNATLGICVSCAGECVSGCSGSSNRVGTGGCNLCEVIVLDSFGQQVRCLSPGSQCPNNYYPDASTQFNGLSSNGKLCRPCHMTCSTCNGPSESSCTSCQYAFITNGGSFTCLTQCPPPPPGGNVTSNCGYCHMQCNGCSGPANTDCTSCNGGTSTNSQGQTVCVPICTADQYRLEVAGEYLCLPCHSQCNGCTGPANTQCKACTNVNNTYTTNNECTAVCPYGSYRDEHHRCIGCDPQCNGCTGPSSFNCSVCSEDSLSQANGEIVCVPSCPLWQVYDISSSSCALILEAQMAVIVASSVTGGVLLVLACILAVCCVVKCRKKYKIPQDFEMTTSKSPIFIKGKYNTTSI